MKIKLELKIKLQYGLLRRNFQLGIKVFLIYKQNFEPKKKIKGDDLPRGLEISPYRTKMKEVAGKHEDKLHVHTNVEALGLPKNHYLLVAFKRKKPYYHVLWKNKHSACLSREVLFSKQNN